MKNYKECLEVSKSFKQVNYDGTTYRVKHLRKLRRNLEKVKHMCIDGLSKTIELNWTIEFPKKGKFRAGFCNKCKTLVIKKLKKKNEKS